MYCGFLYKNCTKTSECAFWNDYAALLLGFLRSKTGHGCTTLKCQSYICGEMKEETTVSSFKSTIERIKTLETERKNLLLEIEELKRMADAKAKALESEINMLRDEVKSLRVLLSGEEIDSDLRKKR